MYKKLTVAVVIPCYNEEKLIGKTIKDLPAFVDHIITVNDASKDSTLATLKGLAAHNKKIIVIDNPKNLGVGGALISGYETAVTKTKAEAIGIVAGDAQFNTDYLAPMLDEFIEHDLDYIKASRFFHAEAFKKMPKYRQVGNIVISLLTKFSTGYYSITDITNGCGFLRRRTIEKVDFNFVEKRYDYETSMLTALSIVGAKVKDHAVPAIYGDEKSTIKLLPTVMRNLRAVWRGYWRRIYYKYVLYGFHPIALFIYSSVFLSVIGWAFTLFILYDKVRYDLSASTATVMLAVLPITLAFQLFLSAIIMDMNNEPK